MVYQNLFSEVNIRKDFKVTELLINELSENKTDQKE
jgi:hypothetical protein